MGATHAIESPPAGHAARPLGKMSKGARMARGVEPTRLPLIGRLAGWDPKWRVGYILCEDGREFSVGGPGGFRPHRSFQGQTWRRDPLLARSQRPRGGRGASRELSPSASPPK